MADNTELDPGTGGDVIATDDVAGVKYQRVKLVDGTADSTAAIPGDATNGLDVDVTRSALPSGAATSAKQDTIIGHVDGVEGLLTTIDADTGTIAGAVSGSEMQVDVVGALPAGTNAIGKLAANSGVDIGDVDVTSSALPTGAATSAKQDTAQTALDAIKTAVELLDDAVIADDAAFTVGTTKTHVAGFFADQASPDSVTEGDIGAARITLDRKQIVTVAPSADTEGLTIFRSIDLDESEEEVKATAGKIFGWYLFNAHSATLYMKLYNATAANTTVGTTTPILTIPVPAGSAANVEFTNGITFGTALSAAVTTGLADNDTGAPSANVFQANIFYQ